MDEKITAAIPIIISSLSFVIAFLAFYFAQLRPPKLQFHFGHQFLIYYPRDGGFGIYMPITVTNTSINSGIVSSCALVISKEGSSEYCFFDWAGFGKRDEDTGGWKFEQAAHPLVIPGRSSVSHMIWYVWRPATEPSFHLLEGTYTFQLISITDEKTKPRISRVRKVYFPPELVRVLDERRKVHDPMSQIWSFSDEIEENQVLSEREFKNMKQTLKRFDYDTIQAYRKRIK
jgi:hypothetical protein